ncbi:archaetidylserine decarboxylase [Leisingera sp. JC11]|uniref:archaetidylserine decarboxylase n=1 Tax=Leisingera sp. JC11 TaxID=3042469 RepID=UPI00345606E1
MQRDPILVVDRETGETFEEAVLGEKWIRWAYQNASARPVEKLLFRSSLVSRLMGAWFDSRFSKSKITAVIDELSIDMSEATAPADSYGCFNDFFVRNLRPEARPYSADPQDVVSPADGRVLVFPELAEDVFVPVKGYPMSVRTMLPGIAERFIGGALAIVRLCPADYHRYHFPAAGRITAAQDIPGALHSVNPIALGAGPDVFGENKRTWTLIETATLGSYCFVEVGAFGVGSIVNTRTSGAVQKMDEKGYFKFGGSTVVVVFEPGKIRFSDDLVANSAKGRETLVKVGQPLATAL